MMDFKNLNVLQETIINSILDEDKERQIRQKPIRDYLKNYFITEISEVNNYQIAKIRRKNVTEAKEWMYAAFIDYKPLNEMGMTFDQAVLICLNYKYQMNGHAVGYIEKMIDANFEYEMIPV